MVSPFIPEPSTLESENQIKQIDQEENFCNSQVVPNSSTAQDNSFTSFFTSSLSSWVPFGNESQVDLRNGNNFEMTMSDDLVATSGSSDASEHGDNIHDPFCSRNFGNFGGTKSKNDWMTHPTNVNIMNVVPMVHTDKSTKENVSRRPPSNRLLPPPSDKDGRLRTRRNRSQKDGETSTVTTATSSDRSSRRSRSLASRRTRSRSQLNRTRSKSRTPDGKKRAARSLSKVRYNKDKEKEVKQKQGTTPTRPKRASSCAPTSRTRSTQRSTQRRSSSLAPKRLNKQRSRSLSRPATKSRSRSTSRLRKNNTGANTSMSFSTMDSNSDKVCPPSPPLSPTADIQSPPIKEQKSRNKENMTTQNKKQTNDKAKMPRVISKMNSNTEPVREVPSLFTNSSAGSITSDESSSTPSTFTLPSRIHTRNLLTTSVYHNEATDIWITTINMHQKSKVTKSNAAKYLKAFSFPTEREARESAYANAPPKMLPFENNRTCFSCDAKFSVFKRAAHCRNCGVCICTSCSTTWKSISLPDTYNMKNESSVRVCNSCVELSRKFRKSLEGGRFDDAVAIYNTGNINLRCPFKSSKGAEIMLPIHCAVQGGNLLLLRWLVDVHFCPVKRIRTSNKSNAQASEELISTSKGRTVVELAMTGQRVDILKYLVNEKNVSVCNVKNLETSLLALQAVLKNQDTYDEEYEQQNSTLYGIQTSAMTLGTNKNDQINQGLPLYNVGEDEEDSEDDKENDEQKDIQMDDDDDDESVATTVQDACIICYENTIDCVITPCGHQICCLECSKNLATCPVCNVDCKFIRIFRP